VTEAQLDAFLSEPSAEDIDIFRQLAGDLVVLGAGGKMGPSLVRRAQKAIQAAGSNARVFAVARSPIPGIATITADLLDRRSYAGLPDAANVIYMVGRKFGSTDNAPLTWATNVWAAGLAAERYAASRIVAFSTGNVYPLVPVASGGATENTPTAPVGEYAESARARERLLHYFSVANGTPMTILRLNYAVDLRYGVLLDIAQAVLARRPLNLTMGYVNVIWQGDANSICLRALPLSKSPPCVLNVTGPEAVSVRWLASEFGKAFGVEPVFEGEEAETALLSDASLCVRLLGKPSVDIGQMIEMTAQWVRTAGVCWDKPTHFETRSGAF